LAAIYFWHGVATGDDVARGARQQIAAAADFSMITVAAPTGPGKLAIVPQPDGRDVLAARFRFRLLPPMLITQKTKTGEIGQGRIPGLHVPAAKFLAEGGADPAEIQDKIVLIGSTYEALGDIHNTPVGNLPGVYLIANSLNLFLEGNQLSETWWHTFLLVAVTILLTSLFFSHLSARWGLVLLAGPSFFSEIIVVPVSVWLFSAHGVFLDFWLPFFGIGLVDTFFDIRELRQQAKQKKEQFTLD
jgi:CHASE2 domain-containing sensor protein